jgi:hypothetical protein
LLSTLLSMSGADRVAMTPATPPLLTALAAWPAGPGSTTTARRASRRWTDHPLLASCRTPGQAALALAGPDGTAVLEALTARPGDDWAATAAVAGLVPWMAPIASRWARSGMGASDVDAAVADLVGECAVLLAVGRPGPQPAAVVQSAWHRVHNTRRTERARTARHYHLDRLHLDHCHLAHLHFDHPAVLDRAARPDLGSTAVERLLVELAAAVGRGTVSVGSAQALAWQAAGWPTAEVAARTGLSPATLRARRARAVRVLAAGRVA